MRLSGLKPNPARKFTPSAPRPRPPRQLGPSASRRAWKCRACRVDCPVNTLHRRIPTRLEAARLVLGRLRALFHHLTATRQCLLLIRYHLLPRLVHTLRGHRLAVAPQLRSHRVGHRPVARQFTDLKPFPPPVRSRRVLPRVSFRLDLRSARSTLLTAFPTLSLILAPALCPCPMVECALPKVLLLRHFPPSRL